MTMTFSGSLVCVGVGAVLDAHMTPATHRQIAHSDVVFAADLDPTTHCSLRSLHNDVRYLRTDSAARTSLPETDDMNSELVLDEIRRGKKVSVVFSGHPSRTSSTANVLVRAAHQEGFHATFEPAISIEDCIYAHLRIDPAKYGCQQYDVRQIMLYRRSIDTSAYLLLWKFGEREMRPRAHRRLLLDVLHREYPLDHRVFVYVPPILGRPYSFAECMMGSLVGIEAHPQMAIVIPPATDLLPDAEIRARLSLLDEASSAHT